MLSNNPIYLWILIFSSTAFTTLKYEKVLYCYLQTLASLRLLVTRADNLLPCTLLLYGCSGFPRDLHDDRNPVVVKLVLKNWTHIAGYLEVVESYKNRKIASSQSLHYTRQFWPTYTLFYTYYLPDSNAVNRPDALSKHDSIRHKSDWCKISFWKSMTPVRINDPSTLPYFFAVNAHY